MADSANEQRGLVIPHEYQGSRIFHSGGELAFGPDGLLYFGVGDNDTGEGAGDALGLAQDVGSLRGKVLRLDVETGNPATYTIPATNPYAGTPGARPEIWAVGMRNPWRSSFDRLTGDYYIGDVGQNAFEEINFQPAGALGGRNYGWPIMEGPNCHAPLTGCDVTGLTLPVGGYENRRSIDDCSITGGRVYRGTVYPRMQGIYFYGDFCSGKIWGLQRVSNVWQSALLRDPATATPVLTSEGLVSFGEDEVGNLYVTDSRAGLIYKIVDAPGNTPPTAVAGAAPSSGPAPLSVNFSSAGSTDADGTIVGYAWAFGDGAASSLANPSHTYASAGTYSAMLSVTDDMGLVGSTSVLITVTGSGAVPPAITQHPVGQTVSAGANVTLTGAASGTPAPGYQWRKTARRSAARRTRASCSPR